MNGAQDMGQKREVISRSGPQRSKRNDPYVSIYRNYSGFVSFEDCQSHQCQQTVLFLEHYNESLTSCHNLSHFRPDRYVSGYPSPRYVTNKGSDTAGIERVIAAIGGQTVQSFVGPFIIVRPNGKIITNHISLTARVCLGSSHAFMWDRASQSTLVPHMNMTGIFNLTCPNCSVHECMGPQFDKGRLYIIARPKYALTVVKTQGWYRTPADNIMSVLDQKITSMMRFKRCISCVVLGITLLVELIVSSTALAMSVSNTQNSVQEANALHDLMRNVSEGFQRQAQMDKEFYNAIRALQKAVLFLGHEVAYLELQSKLQCDYRYNTFCLTPKQYDATEMAWEKIRAQLQGVISDNMTLELQQLIQLAENINQASHEDLLPHKTAQNILDFFQHADPWHSLKTWLISLGSGVLTLLILVAIIPILLKWILLTIRNSLFSTKHTVLAMKEQLYQNKKGEL